MRGHSPFWSSATERALLMPATWLAVIAGLKVSAALGQVQTVPSVRTARPALPSTIVRAERCPPSTRGTGAMVIGSVPDAPFGLLRVICVAPAAAVSSALTTKYPAAPCGESVTFGIALVPGPGAIERPSSDDTPPNASPTLMDCPGWSVTAAGVNFTPSSFGSGSRSLSPVP